MLPDAKRRPVPSDPLVPARPFYKGVAQSEKWNTGAIWYRYLLIFEKCPKFNMGELHYPACSNFLRSFRMRLDSRNLGFYCLVCGHIYKVHKWLIGFGHFSLFIELFWTNVCASNLTLCSFRKGEIWIWVLIKPLLLGYVLRWHFCSSFVISAITKKNGRGLYFASSWKRMHGARSQVGFHILYTFVYFQQETS